jgi:hypothetical protein
MKKSIYSVIIIVAFAILGSYSTAVQAQDEQPRKSPKASVSQVIGVDTEITINYGRPAMRGRNIYWDVVPNGMEEGNNYSDNKPFPWRAGANENSTFEFNKDLEIEGQVISAGKYSIHMIPSESTWVVIFNKVNDAWGSYKYDQSQDALRVTVSPVKAPSAELLTYGFEDIIDYSATAYLHWGEKKIPLRLKVAGSN